MLHQVSDLLRSSSLTRSRPFDVRSFFEIPLSQPKMGNDPEKDGVSAEIMQPQSESPAPPSVSSSLEKGESSLPNIHPAVYVM